MNALFSMMEHAQDETIHLRFRLSSPAHLCWYGSLGSCHKQLVASRNAQVHIDVILPVGFWRFSLRRPAGILAGFVHMSSFINRILYQLAVASGFSFPPRLICAGMGVTDPVTNK